MSKKAKIALRQLLASGNLKEIAEINGVLPRYMAMSSWNPGRKRPGSARSRSK